MSQDSFSVPILLLVFNRPDLTAKVFDVIRRVRPLKLYVSADAPRLNKNSDAALCSQVRQIVTDVDWPCQLQTQFFSENQGCRDGEALGMDWFFSNEPEGIVLEDDTLPLPSFFPYCQSLLDKYRDCARVFSISGNSYLPSTPAGHSSYFFSNYADYWGWAGWSRSWKTYDRYVKEFPSWYHRDGLTDVFPLHYDERRYWYSVLDRTFNQLTDTWDYQMLFNMWSNQALSVMPRVNLVHNLGFRSDGTHTTRPRQPSWLRKAVFADLDIPLIHPDSMLADSPFDHAFYRTIFAASPQSSSLLSRLTYLFDWRRLF